MQRAVLLRLALWVAAVSAGDPALRAQQPSEGPPLSAPATPWVPPELGPPEGGVLQSPWSPPPASEEILPGPAAEKGLDAGIPPLPHSQPGQFPLSAPTPSESWPVIGIRPETPAEMQGWHPISSAGECANWYRVDGQVRGYYLNDQRIEWSGQEATFGAEGAIMPVFRRRAGDWEFTVLGEFYLNQPFNRNLLADTAERRSYLANYETDTFEISQLHLAMRRGDWEVVVGKMATPFGRTHFRLFTNSRIDAPFIRTEAICWRETGALVRWDPSWLVCEAALTNGCDDRDTNSSKALVARLGFDWEGLSGGVSAKAQDGIGSEGQKQYRSHYGVDLGIRWSIFTLSCEAIYDLYGFRRPGYDPDDIFWGRSIYYRDVNLAHNDPLKGLGYYLNLGICWQRWAAELNYGEYYPDEIGDPRQDTPNRRGIVKLDYDLAERLETYGVLLVENDLDNAQDGRTRRGIMVLGGVQYTF